mgnify:CR=1 FL=1
MIRPLLMRQQVNLENKRDPVLVFHLSCSHSRPHPHPRSRIHAEFQLDPRCLISGALGCVRSHMESEYASPGDMSSNHSSAWAMALTALAASLLLQRRARAALAVK